MSEARAGITRLGLTWLLLAQALVMVPFVFQLPAWLMVLWAGCTFWRVQILRMRAPYPGITARIALLVGVVAGVWQSGLGWIGLEPTALLLLCAFLLKLLEMRTERDALLVVHLGFFCVVVAYLFDSSLQWALYSLLPIGALLAALVALQQTSLIEKPWPTLRLVLGMLGQALPLMLLLFLFFPRLDPLWSLPQPGDSAVTGLTDDLAPGDIARLSQSDALAFRATFEGTLPARQQLYWRALTLDRFDGRRWTASPWVQAPAGNWQPQGQPVTYSIIQEPSGHPWLYTLDTARVDLNGATQKSDYRWQWRLPLHKNLLYRVTTWPDAVRDATLTDAARRQALQLPEKGDPRSREWAQQLRREHPEVDELARAMLAWFHDQPYYYTLEPPPLGADSIDSFLFDTRRGFCAHYAGAMVFVLRAAGIPARMVTGYQGGEWNTRGNYLMVRQADAHAWVEYWQAGQGWRRIDPTFAVAPQRIEQGSRAVLGESQASSWLGVWRYGGTGWLRALTDTWDNLNYAWQRFVLDYQGEQQQRWISQIGWWAVWLLPAGLLVFLGGLCLWLLKPWRTAQDPELKLFGQFEKLLARQGLKRRPGEAAGPFAQRAARALPGQAEPILAFAEAFNARRYGDAPIDRALLVRQLTRLRRRR